MMNLSELVDKKSNATEFTVSELSGVLKKTVEDAFGNVRVRGEISGYRGPQNSGHAYFSLKDDKARLDAIIWRGVMGKLKFVPEEGMEIIACGRLSTYPGSSRYQLIIESFEPAGAGALMALLEQRRKKLAEEGLFDDDRKQALPFMPVVIGVITSPTGAVIRDIIHRISDRFPLHILVWPVRVQGETCASEVAAAITGFNSLTGESGIPHPDVIIVARGGGSLEDLWGFNDESIVRAVAASDLPVISAVGHETDWTLIDYVADRRAPTPTGAAEMAVPVKIELEAGLASLNARFELAVCRLFDFHWQRLSGISRGLPSPDQLLAVPRLRCDEVISRLSQALVTSVSYKKGCFKGFVRQLSHFIILRALQEKRRNWQQYSGRLPQSLLSNLARRQHDYTIFSNRLISVSLFRTISFSVHKLRSSVHRIETAFQRICELSQQHFNEISRLMKMLSLESILDRGFALVLDSENRPVKKAGDVVKGKGLTLRFIDGEVYATANEKKGLSETGQGTRDDRKTRKDNNLQGTLF